MISHLADMTWREVEARINPKLVALWPIGAIEAHGPHLPLSTDVIISEETAGRAAQKLDSSGRDVLILPSLVFTPAGYAGGFAGTISVTVEAAAAMVADVLKSMTAHGLRTMALVNSHVDPSNLAMLKRAAEGTQVIFPDITRKPWVLRMPEEFKSGGAHAGEFETSLVMAARPELVRESIRKSLPRVKVNLGQKIKEGAKTFHDCGGPEAYFGDPASASASKGNGHFETLAGIVVEAVLAEGATS